MKKKNPVLLTLPLLALLAAPPAWADNQGSSRGHWGETQAWRLQVGVLEPRGESSYWDDLSFDFTGDADNFDDALVGLEYTRYVSDRLGVVASASAFEGTSELSYRDYVDEFGNDIYHSTDLDMATFNLGLLVHLTRRDRAIVPYLGAGGGLYSWRLTEHGDFIDFSLATPEVFFDIFEDDGTSLGYYLQAGLEVPVARSVSVFAEGRWQRADAKLEGDFAGLGDLDLSGRTLSAGLTWSF
ncbi:MAG: porin family protein [Acidobacteriota bacterium]|nr:porin family protein [Acidobacteriota bacterium]